MAKTVPFGSYELTRRIARGGMAEIFLAVERGLGGGGVEREVAIKRILPHMSESDDFMTMFMDEARVAARLSHPNIAHIYNFGEVRGVYFLAMEFIDGLTCAKLIRWNRAVLPLEVSLRIVADVCAALAYAHDLRDGKGRLLGVVHRDVSPQNVMVSRAGMAKLLDFEVAKASTQVHSTNAGHVKGKRGDERPTPAGGAHRGRGGPRRRAVDGETSRQALPAHQPLVESDHRWSKARDDAARRLDPDEVLDPPADGWWVEYWDTQRAAWRTRAAKFAKTLQG